MVDWIYIEKLFSDEIKNLPKTNKEIDGWWFDILRFEVKVAIKGILSRKMLDADEMLKVLIQLLNNDPIIELIKIYNKMHI